MVFICATCKSADAASLRVVIPGLSDIYQVDMLENETAEVTVFLSSSGDTLGGFKILLRKSESKASPGPWTRGKILEADDSGIVTFTGVEPGIYEVTTEKKPSVLGGDSSVMIGDLRINVISAKSKSSDKPDLKSESRNSH